MKKKKCIILLPTYYNDGKGVPTEVLNRIKREIDEVFDGHRIAGVGEGAYRMANGSMAYEPSLELWVAVEPEKIEVLRKLARRFARILKQETIYFEVVNSEVEFIEPEHESGTGNDQR
jgi:hypothetical protein